MVDGFNNPDKDTRDIFDIVHKYPTYSLGLEKVKYWLVLVL